MKMFSFRDSFDTITSQRRSESVAHTAHEDFFVRYIANSAISLGPPESQVILLFSPNQHVCLFVWFSQAIHGDLASPIPIPTPLLGRELSNLTRPLPPVGDS